MTALDRILPTPRLLETDGVDLAVPPSVAWELVRHGDLGASPIVHALFAIRTLPGRLAGRAPRPRDCASTIWPRRWQARVPDPG